MAKCLTGCANKWEWVSVNGSWTGLVGRRHEKSVGHSKLRLYMFNFFSFFFFFLTAAQSQTMTLQYDEGGHFTEEEYQVSWK